MLRPVLAATILTGLIGVVVAVAARLKSILPPNRAQPGRRRSPSFSPSSNVKAHPSRRLERASLDDALFDSPTYLYQHFMVVLGSGGHTAEMLLMLRTVALSKWRKRSWVVSSGDEFSASLATEFEAELQCPGSCSFDIVKLPRARKVHQSIFTTPFTSLVCLWTSLSMLSRDAPDIILTNGPGTGVIVVFASILLRFFGVDGSHRTRCVYVESLARCKTLSLSGRLLKMFVDRFLVQWPELGGGRAEFKGCLALDAAIAIGMNGIGDTEFVPLMEFLF
ncbi:uncharacterized protein PV09_03644 [Verruconis gallopava]|uniref:UDP-N-acetylglucosamine transferase subunit ALG14 n=1 Tax=Verruconis gallopava TaxID=253628 RepID=A0A0D2AF42_9PEZI|nr:uncharacterized protein PV09_03644 [Verruconis gallopava]KIW05085.1 hypothetical protein PV09_03644 [Verruconis gallopava]